MTSFNYKLSQSDKDKILAIADSSLVNKTLQHGEVEVCVNENFYGSDECNEIKALELAKSATIINAIGNEIVNFLVKEGIIKNESVIIIDKVKHAQVVTI